MSCRQPKKFTKKTQLSELCITGSYFGPDPKVVPDRLLRQNANTATQVRPEGTRPCPRCAKIMSVITLKNTHVDICPDCKGLFLDQGELNGLLDSVEPG